MATKKENLNTIDEVLQYLPAKDQKKAKSLIIKLLDMKCFQVGKDFASYTDATSEATLTLTYNYKIK